MSVSANGRCNILFTLTMGDFLKDYSAKHYELNSAGCSMCFLMPAIYKQ